VSLTGTVHDRNFGEGIAGANVRLMSLERVLETESRAGGLFEFHNVPPGGYEMNIKGPGYIRQKQHIELQKDMNPEPVVVSLRISDTPDMEVCGAQSSVKYTPIRTVKPRVSGAVLDMFSKKRVHARVLLLPKVNGGFSFESQTGGRGSI
jgi:hypothetical protein